MLVMDIVPKNMRENTWFFKLTIDDLVACPNNDNKHEYNRSPYQEIILIGFIKHRNFFTVGHLVQKLLNLPYLAT